MRPCLKTTHLPQVGRLGLTELPWADPGSLPSDPSWLLCPWPTVSGCSSNAAPTMISAVNRALVSVLWYYTTNYTHPTLAPVSPDMCVRVVCLCVCVMEYPLGLPFDISDGGFYGLYDMRPLRSNPEASRMLVKLPTTLPSYPHFLSFHLSFLLL